MSGPPAGLRAMRRRRRIGPGLIVALGASLLLGMLLAVGGLVWHDRDMQLDQADQRNRLMARMFIEHVLRSLDAAELAQNTLAEPLARGEAPDGPQMQAAYAQTLVSLPFVSGLAVFDAEGRVLASTHAADAGRRLDPSAFGSLPAPGGSTTGGFVPARGPGSPAAGRSALASPGAGVLPLLRAITGPNGRPWYIVALIDPLHFTAFQRTILADEHAAAALVDADGRLIAATDGVARAQGERLDGLRPLALQPPPASDAWVGEGLRAGRQVAAFRASPSRGLGVLVEYDQDAVIEQWAASVRGIALAALAATLFIAAVTAMASRSLRSRELAQRHLDQVQARTAQREQELSATIGSLQELVFRTGVRGDIGFVNERWTAFAGTPAGEAQGRRLWDLVAAPQRAAAQALFLPDPGLGLRREQLAVTDGRGVERSYEVAVMPLLRDAQVLGFAGSAVDITERLAAQRGLKAQLALTGQLMEVSPLPTSVTDLSRRYLLVNRAWEEFTGRRREDVVGQEAGAHLVGSEREASQRNDRQVIATGLPARYEAVYVHCDGTPRDVIVNKLLLPSQEGSPAGVLSVVMDVTEFRHAERSTRAASEAAEEASRSKSEFIANVSHELRTPLQTIIGFAELGALRAREHERFAAMFGDIHAAGRRMLALVNDLLDVAKIESSVGAIDLERTDLRGLLREVTDELRLMAASRGLQLALSLPPMPVLAKVDPLRIQQVMRNVIANAIKFAPQGSAIEIGAGYNPQGEPHLRVADRGPGIPEAEVEKIFEAFVQSSKTKDGSGGTGLGLAICRKIVDAHGGVIRAENRKDGGAAFHIVLPARGAMETMPAPL
jgi:PAS domain S-box-containing protein